MKIYFDNAATTALSEEVLNEMLPYMREYYGNPSSIHAMGAKSRAAIEKSRKIVANSIKAATSEIFFTSGGTEANNTILKSAVDSLGVTHIITSSTEHHCILHTLDSLKEKGVTVTYLSINQQGEIDYTELATILQTNTATTLVSLMHANNEIGTITNLEKVSNLCQQYGAFFHSDTVQTMGYYPIDTTQLKIDFLSGSAHKFHGPKGVGFMYINHRHKINPLLNGGAQERNMRAGTENLYGIVGLGKALALCIEKMEENRQYLSSLKNYMIEKIQQELPTATIIGLSNPLESHYKILTVAVPQNDKSDLIIFNLDIAGIAASGGSACSSGSQVGSHVIAALNLPEKLNAVRFSFSKYNTIAEIDYVIQHLKNIL